MQAMHIDKIRVGTAELSGIRIHFPYKCLLTAANMVSSNCSGFICRLYQRTVKQIPYGNNLTVLKSGSNTFRG